MVTLLSLDDLKLNFPKEIVLNNTDTFKNIGEIIRQKDIKEIVVGESVDFSGKLKVTRGMLDFIEPKAGKVVSLEKEIKFLTSNL